MKHPVQIISKWNQEVFPAGAAVKAELLIEIQEGSGQDAAPDSDHSVGITLQPSDYVNSIQIPGCRSRQIFGEWHVAVGNTGGGLNQTMRVEIELLPHTSGLHPVLLLECSYGKKNTGVTSQGFTYEVHAHFMDGSEPVAGAAIADAV